jgi:hypothetical protein
MRFWWVFFSPFALATRRPPRCGLVQALVSSKTRAAHREAELQTLGRHEPPRRRRRRTLWARTACQTWRQGLKPGMGAKSRVMRRAPTRVYCLIGRLEHGNNPKLNAKPEQHNQNAPTAPSPHTHLAETAKMQLSLETSFDVFKHEQDTPGACSINTFPLIEHPPSRRPIFSFHNTLPCLVV